MRAPGVEYHSLMHSLQLIRFFKENYENFRLEDGFEAKLADPVMDPQGKEVPPLRRSTI